MKKIFALLLIATLIALTSEFHDVAASPVATAQTKAKNSTKKSSSTTKKNTRANNSRQKQTGGKKGSGTQKKSGTSGSKANTRKGPRTASEVKKERERNTAALREAKKKIKLNTEETEKRLNQLNLLEGEIANCNINIAALNHRLDSMNGAITSATDSIAALDTRLNAITDRYVKAVRKSQTARNQRGQLAFIFSSKSFSQAYRRMRALKQFDKWRDRKSKEIATIREDLDKRREELERLRKETTSTLSQLNGEKATLERKQGETSHLVERLRTEGAELNSIMQRRQREAQALDEELDRIIAEEAARQERIRLEQEAAKRKAAEEEAARKAREEAEAAEAERQAAIEAEKARQAALEAKKAKEAEQAAQARAAEAERKARETADKEAKKQAEKQAKAEREAAKKAEQERVKAEREAARRQAEADKQLAQSKARKGKPVKHKGKQGAESSEASTTPAARLTSPVASGASGVASSSIDSNLGSDFESAKGKLPYPVSGRYTIVKPFGRQKHPTLPHVETNNSGIDMQTEPGAAVRCVFDGEVSAVFRPDGYNTVVVVRHGKYMTVYANLGAISVSNGQKVKAGQSIGTVFTDTADANRSVLHFEIRNQRLKENPETWLRR